jgi:opacity protein-like surface antigen
MKTKALFIILFITLFALSTVGQSIKIGIGGGYTALTGDNNLTVENVVNLNSGMHYGGKLIVGIPLLPIKFAANIFQNSLSNDASVAGEDLSSETNFLSLGIGAEFTLIPGPIQPYLAGELLFTSFGDVTIDDIKKVETESKTGLGLGAGLYFKLLPVIDLDLSAHYNMNTLLSSGDALNSTHIRLNVLYSIL